MSFAIKSLKAINLQHHPQWVKITLCSLCRPHTHSLARAMAAETEIQKSKVILNFQMCEENRQKQL